ncbi:hypothetical protein C8Q79DRAFT_927408 [Trametes meyenii]|nr:hypothetical protein C8Q79DRAFT_927408 [Trametes meyenii]
MAAKKKGPKVKAACKATPAKTTQKKAQKKKAQEQEAQKKATKKAAAKRRRERKKAAKLKAEKEAAKKEAAKRKAEKKAAQERAEKKKKQKKARKARLKEAKKAKQQEALKKAAKIATKILKGCRSAAQKRRDRARRNAKYLPTPPIIVPTVSSSRPDPVVRGSPPNVFSGSDTKIETVPPDPLACPLATSVEVQAPATQSDASPAPIAAPPDSDSELINSQLNLFLWSSHITMSKDCRDSGVRDDALMAQAPSQGLDNPAAVLSSTQQSLPSSRQHENVVGSEPPCPLSVPQGVPLSESVTGSNITSTSAPAPSAEEVTHNTDSRGCPLPDVPMSATAARAIINAEADRLFASYDLDATIQTFRALPKRYHDRLIDALVSSAVELDEQGASVVCRLFQRDEISEICSADALQAGCRQGCSSSAMGAHTWPAKLIPNLEGSAVMYYVLAGSTQETHINTKMSEIYGRAYFSQIWNSSLLEATTLRWWYRNEPPKGRHAGRSPALIPFDHDSHFKLQASP